MPVEPRSRHGCLYSWGSTRVACEVGVQKQQREKPSRS